MNKSVKLTTEEEIRDFILSKIKSSGTIRVSMVNTICANEGTLFNTLENMRNEGEIDFNESFIFLI